jgi:hypothetical protein
MVDAIVTDAKAEESKVMTFIKTNWGHVVTWFLVAWPALKIALSHL